MLLIGQENVYLFFINLSHFNSVPKSTGGGKVMMYGFSPFKLLLLINNGYY